MNICVYCGSSDGNNPDFLSHAKLFGSMLANNDHTLIYGGASIGIMGCLADSVMEHGGKVIGVIPRSLFQKEVAHPGITELIEVDDMHQRKSAMAEFADAFVAFPGGFGTMEELFEIITWNQIGIFEKPVTIMNVDGFYDPLIAMIDHALDTEFIKKECREIIQVAETLDECLEFCASESTT